VRVECKQKKQLIANDRLPTCRSSLACLFMGSILSTARRSSSAASYFWRASRAVARLSRALTCGQVSAGMSVQG
jgi:hypothetical protein